jgi:DNA transposition AAA+ family ATPase
MSSDSPVFQTPVASDAPSSLHWDDTAIERESATVPARWREDYRWLKTWVRDRCAREPGVLVERARALGIHFDRSTWSRILRGRCFVDSAGAPRKNAVVIGERFAEAVEALRTKVRAETLRGRVPFVETTTWEDISQYLSAKRAGDRVNRWGIVVGPTGSQKTCCFKEYRRRHDPGLVWWLEAPADGGTGELLNRLSVGAGVGHGMSSSAKRARLLESLREHHTVVIDNVQDLYRDGEAAQPAFSFLRRLQDETGCCVILSITPAFERELLAGLMMGYFEQFEGRTGGRRNWLRLPEYAPEEDILRIAQAFQFADPKRHLRKLVEISREPGRIRRLFDDLQEARILANAAGQPLVIRHLLEARGED